MKKIQLPTNSAELVKYSCELVTDERFNLAKTWLFPSADSGDNVSVPETSPILQQAENTATDTTEPIVNPTLPTLSLPINFLANNPARLPVCEGNDVHSSNNDLEAPEMINLESSGLRRSQRIKSMKNPNNDSPTIMAYISSIKKEGISNCPKIKITILAFF